MPMLARNLFLQDWPGIMWHGPHEKNQVLAMCPCHGKQANLLPRAQPRNWKSVASQSTYDSSVRDPTPPTNYSARISVVTSC